MGMEIPPRGSPGATTPSRLNRLFAPMMKLQMASNGAAREPSNPE